MTAEAEIEDGEQPAEAVGKRKLSKRMMIIIATLAGTLIAAGTAGYFLFFAAPMDTSERRLPDVPRTFIFNLPSMTVNLNTSEGEGEQFMKLTVALEVQSEEMMQEIQPRLAKVIDAFQVYLRELRKSDLEGSAGIYRLKEELRRRINVAIFPAQVESVLFREILVQ
jgi:flagellar protein FliL